MLKLATCDDELIFDDTFVRNVRQTFEMESLLTVRLVIPYFVLLILDVCYLIYFFKTEPTAGHIAIYVFVIIGLLYFVVLEAFQISLQTF